MERLLPRRRRPPSQSRQDHAQVITQLALDMQAIVKESEYFGRKLTFRIGINSGPVIAGVIGRKKFIYDLWGDAVNTASRMESNGLGGLVQVTNETYCLINDEFLCESRGVIHVKGKGELPVWLVRGKKSRDPGSSGSNASSPAAG